MDSAVSLQTLDYVLIGLMLIISLGIGVFFAVRDVRNANRVVYLLGGRRMTMLPVALSIFATFSSGIGYVGLVVDIYLRGAMAGMMLIGFGAGFLCAAFGLVPLMYPLRLTSLYEYLQMRFDSSVVRMFGVVFGMFHTLCYLTIALLSPALALQTGAGLPLWISVGIVGFIGTVYSAIGGIKSVVWADAFQCFVMIGGVLTIIIKGNSIVGGGDAVWRLVKEGGRAFFGEFSFDPRVTNTWWGAIIGGCLFWLGNICNQSTLQRLAAMKSMTEARNAFILSAVLMVIQGGIFVGVAWVMYAYFTSIRCDPLQAGHISSRNQLAVYFVMHALRDLPGIGGIYMSTIFSASLSTVSSGINALAANTVEDILKKPLRNVHESTATFITKVFVFLYGILIIGLAYGANSLKGPLIQMAMTGMGAWGGPMVGIFLLGALCPWGNKYGAVGGGVIAVGFNMWIAVGSHIYGRKPKVLSSPPTDMCFLNSSITEITTDNATMLYFENEVLSGTMANQSAILNTYTGRGNPEISGFFLYDISFEWYALTGTSISLFVGMAISYCFRRRCSLVIDEKLIFPCVLKFFQLTPQQVKGTNLSEEEVEMLQLPELNLKDDMLPEIR